MKTSLNPAAGQQAGFTARCVSKSPTLALLLTILLTTTSPAQQAQPDAAVATDQPSYLPGDSALVFGSGFQPGETVVLRLGHEDGTLATGPNDGPWQAVSDGAGQFSGSLSVCQEDCPGMAVWLSASGQSSRLTAQTRFVIYPLPSAPLRIFVITDRSDYPPGSTAYISGGGFQAGETVVLQVLHADGQPATGAEHEPWAVVADGNGALTSTWHVCEDDCLGSTLRLSAVGQTSGLEASAFFTDGCPNLGGQLFAAFDPGSAPDDAIYSMALQSDGKVVIGGIFSRVHGVVHNNIARLNADGSTDLTFLNGLAGFTESSATIYTVAIQPDGKVLVGGQFGAVSGVIRRGLVRLNHDGTIDSTFPDPAIQTGVGGPGGIVQAIVVQPDGKILIGGNFALVNGVTRNRIARLNSDGSLDTTFQNGMTGAANSVLSIALQPDGAVLIGGVFTSVNGVTRNQIARLNSDGSLDTTFQNGMTGANLYVNSMSLQPDGKVVIVGDFNLVNGVSRNRIARLNNDGSLDTTFQNGMAGANGTVSSVSIQADGRVLLGGSFISVNGVVRNRVARLNADGSLDTTFLNGMSGIGAATVSPTVNSIVLQPDGQILVGGQFESANDLQRRRIARLNVDGTTDVTFQNGPPGPNDLVECLALQADGKVIIGGFFSSLSAARNRIARLNTDGSLDTAFLNGMTGPNSTVYAAAVQPDGKVLIAGQFNLVNGTSRLRLARLNPDGSLDTGFAPSAGSTVVSLALQADGRILIGGLFPTVNGISQATLARLNSDGTLDTTFSPIIPGSSQVTSIVVQPDGRILIGGSFSTVNGATRNGVARVNSDGSLDTTFLNGMTGVGGVVYSIALQSDGRVLIVGSFNVVNGVTRTGIARLNSDGSLDTTFQNGMTGANPTPVYAVAVQPDGKVVIGGEFITVNGVTRGHIAQLNANGSVDTTFQNALSGANDYVRSVLLQPDGNVLIGGAFTSVNGVPRERVARLYGTTPDVTPPVINCPPNMIVSTDPGQCSAVVSYPAPIASDDCLAVTVSTAPSGSTFPKGTTTVICTATDASGNSASCSFTVTVNDTEPPAITCPANVTVNTDPGLCSASGVALGSPVTTDNCGVASVANNAPAVFPKGVTTVTWTVTDTSGNTAQCQQTITVIDTEPPTITCPANVTVSTDTGLCSASGVALGSPVTADNCGVASVVNNAPAVFPKGVTTVAWSVTDTSGNTAQCQQTITVIDTEPPAITCPANVTVNTDPGLCSASGVALGSPVTTDNCGVASVVNNAPAVFPKGITTVTWTVTDTSGNTAQCQQTVTVIDTQPPTITCPANVTVGTDPGLCGASVVALGSPVTADNCGVAGVVNNAPAVFPKGTTVVTWTVTDTSGNTAQCQQTVTVNDTQPPTITCPANVTVNTVPGLSTASGVALGSPVIADNCAVASVGNNAPAVFPTGITTVTWTAIDTSGNAAQCQQTVTVVGAELPMLESVGLSSTVINENDTVTLSGTITAPAGSGVSTLVVDWGDGTIDSMPATAGAFSLAHQYLDDNPTATAADNYNITVSVSGATGSSQATANVTVNNVAPVITSVTGPTGPLALGNTASVTVSFSDVGSLDTHTVRISWDEGTPDALVTSGGFSRIANHTYTAAGVYTLGVTVTDDDSGQTTTTFKYIVIYDPTAGYVTGKGWILSPPGAYAANPLLTGQADFGFVSKYKKGATVPTGKTEFQFSAGQLDFQSQDYQYLVVSGPLAQFKGTGYIAGGPLCGFLLTATDGQIAGGGGTDKFRIKIWDLSSGVVLYDNRMGASDDINSADPQALGGGTIVIHK